MLSGCPVCAKPLKRIASTPTHVPVEVVEPPVRGPSAGGSTPELRGHAHIDPASVRNPVPSFAESAVELLAQRHGERFRFLPFDRPTARRCVATARASEPTPALQVARSILATEFRRRLMKGRATHARKEHLFSIFSRTAPSRNGCEPGGHDPLEVRRQASPDPGSAIAYGTVVSPRISSTVRNCRWVHIRRRFEAAYEADAIISSLSLVQDFEPFSHRVVFSRLKMRHSRSS